MLVSDCCGFHTHRSCYSVYVDPYLYESLINSPGRTGKLS